LVGYFLIALDERSDLDESDVDYGEEDFEDEKALGIQIIDDEVEDDQYSDNFDEVFDEAEDLRRVNTHSSKRPISKKYIRTPASDRLRESSKVDEKYRADSSKEKIDEHECSVKDIFDQSNFPEKIEEEFDKEQNTKDSIQKSVKKQADEIEVTNNKSSERENSKEKEKIQLGTKPAELKKPKTKQVELKKPKEKLKEKPEPAVTKQKPIKRQQKPVKEKEVSIKHIQKPPAKILKQVVQLSICKVHFTHNE
jgi:hypothetical protein